MSSSYTASNANATQVALSSTFQTQLSLRTYNSDPVIIGLTDIWLSGDGSDFVSYDLSAITAGGSEHTFTPIPANPAFRPSVANCSGNNDGGEPTYTNNSSALSVTTAGAYRWTSAHRSGLVILGGTANVGYGLRAMAASYTGTVTTIFAWSES